eukprot:Em0012g614a
MEAALTVRMSVRPPAKFTEKTDWSLWISRFERYVKEAKVPDSERVKELLPLLEDEPLRLVVQYGLSESADYAAVHECLQCRYGHDGTELEWQVKFQARVQQRDESLVEYIGELRMLASRAFPGWSEEQCDVLIRNQFIQGVSSSSIQVQLLKEMPKSVKDAATLARRLETVEMAHRRLQTERIAERPLAVAAPVSATSLEDKLDKLSAQVKKLADEGLSHTVLETKATDAISRNNLPLFFSLLTDMAVDPNPTRILELLVSLVVTDQPVRTSTVCSSSSGVVFSKRSCLLNENLQDRASCSDWTGARGPEDSGYATPGMYRKVAAKEGEGRPCFLVPQAKSRSLMAVCYARGYVCVVVLLAAVASSHYHPTFKDLLHNGGVTARCDGSVSISVTPTVLSTSGDWIAVTWDNKGERSTSDWGGVFTPPVNNSVDLRNHAPVKYQYASFSVLYMITGKGTLKFQLINMRDNMIVGFFTGGSQNPVLLAVSDIIQFQNYNEPLQGHLVLSDDPTEIILIWVTQKSEVPQVVWGPQSGNYTNSKMASSSTYKAGDMCGSPATDFGFLDPGMLHQVTMDNLVPGKKYFYVFGDIFGFSQEYSFTAPPVASPNSTVRVVVYGDMGNGQVDDSLQIMTAQQPALNTTNLIYSQIDQTDLVLHIGDISYARGYASVVS